MESLLFAENQLDSQNNNNYLVLARKYRPSTFSDIIGQDVLIKTFTNAINNKRLAHAFLLTGIRGIGKTTTARIIARALNCIGEDEKGDITLNPCGKCVNCIAIKDDRHQDVIEIDAASHTGVNDIREIIENTRYRPISARFKIYIIDEVHMLSNSAFNALLKTLEEPPTHVKFIFATTEIKKIPLTILSRCQRFDLKRVGINELIAHFKNILLKEGISAADDCLKIIAVSARGSVRDGLSILDQAISHTNGKLETEVVREMLGLTSNEDIFNIYEHLLKNEIGKILEVTNKLYSYGLDPLLIIQDLMNVTHILAKAKIDIDTLKALPEFDKVRIKGFLDLVDIARLGRIWLAFIKGLDEIKISYDTIVSLEMILIRIAHLSNLPSPEDIIRRLKNYNQNESIHCDDLTDNKTHTDGAANENITDITNKIRSLEDIETLLFDNNEIMLCHHLRMDVRLVKIEPNNLVIRMLDGAPKHFNRILKDTLERITLESWTVHNSPNEGEPTLAQKEREKLISKNIEIKAHPTVEHMLNSFTGLEIADIKLKEVI